MMTYICQRDFKIEHVFHLSFGICLICTIQHCHVDLERLVLLHELVVVAFEKKFPVEAETWLIDL
jgi:hypothetical protein